MTYYKQKNNTIKSLVYDYQTLVTILLLALIPSSVIIYLMHDLREKYELELTEIIDNSSNHIQSYYVDLPNTENALQIDIKDFEDYQASCLIYRKSKATTHQINFYGHLPIQSNVNLPIFSDVTGDEIPDMFVFSQKEDSIFINGVDLIKQELLCYGRFIAVIGQKNNNARDFVLRQIINYDKNHDGTNELYFLINAGYCLTPRQLFAYDYINDTLYQSESIGSHNDVTPFHITPDSLCLVSTTLPTNNHSKNDPCLYHDSCAWLIYYNMNLNIYKQAHAIRGTNSRIRGPQEINGRVFYLVTNSGKDIRSDYIVELNRKDHTLSIKSDSFAVRHSRISEIKINNKTHYIITAKESGIAQSYEIDFEKGKIATTPFCTNLPHSEIIPCSIDNKEAFLSKDPITGNALLLLDNLQNNVSFNRPLDLRPHCLYIQSYTENNKTIIRVKDKKNLYTYTLKESSPYRIRYLIWVIIYLLNGVFFIFTGLLYKHKLHKTIKLHDEIRDMELKLLNAQLTPHFTYNVLNLISSKVLQGERFEAYDTISHFATFMRSALLSTNKSCWSIKEELEFLDHYMILMQKRVTDRFNYKLENNLSEELNSTNLPRLMIQNAVENSIKYAFNEKTEKGIIQVNISEENNIIAITITDNGIGIDNHRKQSNKNSTEQGLLISQHQVKAYNKKYNSKINYQVKQLGDGDDAFGTVVSLEIRL